MRDKERLLSFEEKTCFIFAHSALKEGWDNPNVFQICTLNQTVSEIKKRQEIGRGLRLAVNQDGERVFDDDVNILSVIANESYQSYASRLQSEYVEAGQTPPPRPTNAARIKVQRNDQIFQETRAFRDFWAKLQRHTTYRIHVDTPALVKACVERISNRPNPQAVIVVEKGKFIVTQYTLEPDFGRPRVLQGQALPPRTPSATRIPTHIPLRSVPTWPRTCGMTVCVASRSSEIVEDGDNSHILFGNNQSLYSIRSDRLPERARPETERARPAGTSRQLPDLQPDRPGGQETGLTRPTLNEIFRRHQRPQEEGHLRQPGRFRQPVHQRDQQCPGRPHRRAHPVRGHPSAHRVGLRPG